MDLAPPLVAVAATQLQNGYAYAVDTRNWDLFRTLFTADVQAHYPNQPYDGIEHWLQTFIPFHADCRWTRHALSNHVTGADMNGTWAACYGEIEWIKAATPDLVNRSRVIYQDRLVEQDGRWQIAVRRLSLLWTRFDVPLESGVELLANLHDVTTSLPTV